MARWHRLVVALPLIASSCSGPQTNGPANVTVPPQPPAGSSLSSSAASQPGSRAAPATVEGEEAHRLVIASVACWLGGIWSDAEGAPEETRAATAQQRCHELVKWLHGTDDKARYERLRALEVVEVSDLKDEILAVAHRDSVDALRREHLGSFFVAAADTMRETMAARRAGDRVKQDVAGERDRARLTADEVDAMTPLSESKSFQALLGIDVGNLTHEARAVAILCAMDRMETARGLPKHLKVYVLERPYTALFGVPSPDVPRDVLEPLDGGAWLGYITSVAKAAGHPVPDRAKSLTDRELLAWGGALLGLADKLRVEAAEISDETELKHVLETVVRRLDNEYRASERAVLREPEAAGPPRRLGRPPR